MRLPGIWLAAVLTLPVYAQVPLPEEAARESFKKGVAAFHQKEFTKAEKELTEIPELGGYLSLYKHWFLGQTYLELGKYKEAEPEFLKVIQSPASNELKYQAQFFLGETALRQGNHNESIKRLRPLERKWRRSYRLPEVLYRIMQAELKLARVPQACRYARKLYANHPAHALVIGWDADLSRAEVSGKKLPCAATAADFSTRVRRLQLSGESEKAHKEITARLNATPEDQRLSIDLVMANFLVNEGSVDDALNLLIRYYPSQKSNMGYLMLLGKAAARSGEYQTAVGAFERASALSPRSRQGREALYQAAYLSYQFQDYDGAVRKFQQFAKAHPRSGLAKDAQWHLAWLQYLRQDYKGALKRFADVGRALRSRRKNSDTLSERLLYWMAMSHVRLKNFDQARTALETIIARNAYSYYGIAAQARLETIRPHLENVAPRVPAALKAPEPAPELVAEEEKETEEDISDGEALGDEIAQEEGAVEDGTPASTFKDPAMRARIEVAQKLIALGQHELARWELWEVERRTRNPQYLRTLISAYEGIGSYHRSASIAELSFARERDRQGLELGRALWQSAYPQAFKPLVLKYTAEYGAPPEWVWAIMRAESLYRPDVISPVGAKGLMQMMPYTANNLARLAGMDNIDPPKLLNPDLNIRLGAQYLARLQKMFKGQLALASAAYNAGPHRVESWLVNFGHLETDEFVEHIPFLETRNYVKKVVRNHTFYRRLYAKDQAPVEFLAKTLGVPIPARASTRETWDSL